MANRLLPPAALLLVLSATPAAAGSGPLSAPVLSASASVSAYSTEQSRDGSPVSATEIGLYGTATAGASAQSPLSVYSGVDGTPATASSSGSYQIEVIGPANAPIPVEFRSNLRTFAYAPPVTSSTPLYSTAFGRAVFAWSQAADGAGQSFVACDSDNIGCVASGQIVLISETVMLDSNSAVDILLGSEAESSGHGSATASADPYFFIDPEFLSENPGYSIIVSPGVSNDPLPSGGVPEPSAWTLALLGVGAIGGAMRSRRKHLPRVLCARGCDPDGRSSPPAGCVSACQQTSDQPIRLASS
jgi:hypothetical protein